MNGFDFCTNYPTLRALSIFLTIINILKIITPVILVIIIIIDIYKTVMQNDDNMMKDLVRNSVTKLIIGISIFFIPTIVYSFVGLINDTVDTDVDMYTCLQNVENIDYYKELYEEAQSTLTTPFKVTVPSLEIIKTTEPDLEDNNVVFGQTYSVSKRELYYLTGVAMHENGSGGAKGIMAEISFILNMYEIDQSLNRYRYSSLEDYVKNRHWWSSYDWEDDSGTEYPTESLMSAAKSVLEGGNRSFPFYVNEHDCIKCRTCDKCTDKDYDILKIEVNGRVITDKNELLNKANYIKDKTIIYNRYGAVYTFYSFPCNSCDPFGYEKKF